MINLSINQLLVIWGELVSAYFGKNKFGGDTAEIYVSSLMSRSPLAERGDVEAQARVAALADQSLRNVMLKFSEDYDCAVYVDGVGLGGEKMADSPRWHVKVTNNHVG